mmetsp:Transcript_20684/g.27915  ORF Transcript_20684/g.27915 Transcript_20684/m.27915 type:complete len:132 (+) Transcript_20684:520-915(+)
MEHLGKGGANVLGSSIDGFSTGVGYASRNQMSPYPKSLYAPDAGANQHYEIPPTGSPLYSGQIDSDSESECDCEVEAKTDSESETSTESKAVTAAEVEAEAEAETEAENTSEAESETETEAETETASESHD